VIAVRANPDTPAVRWNRHTAVVRESLRKPSGTSWAGARPDRHLRRPAHRHVPAMRPVAVNGERRLSKAYPDLAAQAGADPRNCPVSPT
jgi:hypothetical protein